MVIICSDLNMCVSQSCNSLEGAKEGRLMLKMRRTTWTNLDLITRRCSELFRCCFELKRSGEVGCLHEAETICVNKNCERLDTGRGRL